MKGENTEYVAHSDVSKWSGFTVPIQIDEISNIKNIFTDKVGDIYMCIDGFYNPTYVEVRSVNIKGEISSGEVDHLNDGGLNKSITPPENRERVQSKEITEYLESLSAGEDENKAVLPTRVYFQGNCLIYINSEFRFVGLQDAELYRTESSYESDEYESSPLIAPVEIHLCSHLIENELTIYPNIEFGSDIWFEETRTGKLNKTQALALLARLDGTFEFEEFEYNDPRWGEIIHAILDESDTVLD